VYWYVWYLLKTLKLSACPYLQFMAAKRFSCILEAPDSLSWNLLELVALPPPHKSAYGLGCARLHVLLAADDPGNPLLRPSVDSHATPQYLRS